MPIDINDFREYKGGNPEKIRESQRRRFASESLVDDIIALDQQCRDLQSEVSMLRNQYKTQSAQIGKLKKAGENTDELQKAVQELKANIAKKEQEASEAEIKVKQLVSQVGNYVADDVVVSNDEDKDNKVVKTWGNCDPKGDNLFHHEILHMIGGYDSERGVKVAGARGFFLKGPGVLLNQALINYGLSFLISKEYTPLQPPFFMKRSVMAETAQLSQFDEELYKIPSDNKDDEDAYLIATSEQPISAYHRGEWLQPEQLPLKYVGYSTCFRKEAGSSGRNVWGIFRVHQFEKIEQFVITDPEKSWEMLENMLNFSEEFYQSVSTVCLCFYFLL